MSAAEVPEAVQAAEDDGRQVEGGQDHVRGRRRRVEEQHHVGHLLPPLLAGLCHPRGVHHGRKARGRGEERGGEGEIFFQANERMSFVVNPGRGGRGGNV